jgi:cytochrome c oxidase subunit 4
MTHSTGPKNYLLVFAALMVLLVITVVAAFMPWGSRVGIVVAFTIAVIKAVLVVLYFMHIKGASGLTKVFVIAGLAWLAILMGITLADYHSRTWLNGNAPMTIEPQLR